MTPYGPMYRRDDPAFAAVVDRTFARLGETRRILRTYSAWFLDRLPTGERLGRPTAPQLETMFHTPACRRSEEADRTGHAADATPKPPRTSPP